jgi:diadenosine tetraphosphate (Ap4A) HIT family hydrolase
METLPTPPKESIIYEDEKTYVCLAMKAITNGHTIVAWKKPVADIHSLSCEEYDYLMNIVDVARDVLLKTFGVEKIYMLYMDEIKHVHWHLIPRFNEQGFNMFLHEPKEITDFGNIAKMKEIFSEEIKKHPELKNRL